MTVTRAAGVMLVSALLGLCAMDARGTDDPISVAKNMYAAFGRGDIAGIEALLAPNVEWTMHGPKELIPYAGTYRGVDGVRQFFADVAATITVEAIEQQSFTSEGDVVHVQGRERSVALATDGRFAASWVHMLTVRNGRIVRFEEVTDSARIVEALAPADVDRGRAFFASCAGCHGVSAQGNRFMNAPNLTSMGRGYLLRQLRFFASETRGGMSDAYGWQMNGRAKALPGDRAMRDVAAYIGSLPELRPARTLTGDVVRGKSRYQTCASCHGERGEGRPEMQSPPLRGLDDWYVVRQLENYRGGTRGTHAADTPGAQMRPAALALPNAQALRNVAAYIATLE